jgi:MFS family permease
MQQLFDRNHLIRAIVAGTVGSSVEFYDFVLSANAAVLIFPRVFFPHSDPLTGTLIAISTYSAGFVTRPLGAAFFGHFGDRLGRKSTLVATLLTMGVVSAAIGLLPGYAQVGIWGGVLLTLLRLGQGFAIGGEWAGTILLPIEWGPPARRGFLGSWPHLGFPSGLLTSNIALIVCGLAVGPSAFLDWGWRIPFLIGGLLVLVGFYVRLGVLETPPFTRLLEERRTVARPVVEVFRRNWREIVLSTLAIQPVLVSFYLFATFALSYGTRTLQLGQGFMLVATLSAAAIALPAVIVFGTLSDRLGYKRTYMRGLFAYGLLAFPYFWLMDTRNPALVVVASVAALLTFALLYGPLPAFVTALYSGQVRYTGSSLSYHLAAAIGGGPAPVLAAALLASTRSSAAVAGYVLLSAVVAVAAAAMLRDRSSLDHRFDYAQQARRAPALALPAPAPRDT